MYSTYYVVKRAVSRCKENKEDAKQELNTIIRLDKKKDRQTLQKMREEIAQVMSTVEFEQEAVQTLGYSSNVFEMNAVRQRNVFVSEPWVSMK